MFGKIKNEKVGTHTRGEFQEVLREQGYMCFWCGNPICHPDAARDAGVVLKANNRATEDHLLPLSRRGVDFIWNIVAACEVCNNVRNNRLPGEFLRDRLAFSKPVDNGKKIYTTVPYSRERIDSEVTAHLEVSPFAASCIHYLDERRALDPSENESFWKHRRELLARQVQSLGRRFLEAAGQQQLPLEMPSSPPKPPTTDEGALTFRGMHITERKA